LKKAALIEIDGSHDECLYSQLLFLKNGGYHVTLICSENLRKQVSEFDIADEKVFFDFDKKGAAHKLKQIWKLRTYIIRQKIGTVIFNSLHGRTIRDLTLLPFPKKIIFAGTLHGINKLKGSFTQRVIGLRVRKVFLLNDYMIDNLKLVPNQGLQFQSYYSIFFPQFKNEPQINKPADECWIAIPGQVEYKRRDYETLVRTFAAMPVKPGYKFLLLGNSTHKHSNGTELKELVKELGVADHFVFWDGFLENAVFHAYLKKADIVMPLIHPGNDGFQKYLIYQISGAYNLAFAYKKPLLMLSEFKDYADFKENAIFYTLDDMPVILENLPSLINMMQPQLYKDPKWTFEHQAGEYLRFIR
jgi:glycosyltransferase involved in cell wall biosynthesis